MAPPLPDPPPSEGRSPDQLRISDAERHAVAEVLREAAGEGRIDLDELDERLEATYAAKTYADLVPLTADLPVAGAALPEPVRASLPAQPTLSYASSVGILAETKRRGVWSPGPTHAAFALMGSVVLDLREAQLPPELVINANAVMGSVEITVNSRTVVLVDGTGVMGSYHEGSAKVPAETGPGSPVVRVRGVALMGEVVVRRRAMPGEGPRRLFGRSST